MYNNIINTTKGIYYSVKIAVILSCIIKRVSEHLGKTIFLTLNY